MKHHINLIPPERLKARQVRIHALRWTVVASVYVMLITIGALGGRVMLAGDNGLRPADLEQVRHRIDEVRSIASTRESELENLRRTLRVAERVGLHPDWSVLQRIVASKLGQDLVLERIALRPGGQRGEEGGPPTLVLTGYGRGQTQIYSYVNRLEDTELFDRVSLRETQRQEGSIAGMDSVRFELRATLDPNPIEAQSADVDPTEGGDAP